MASRRTRRASASSCGGVIAGRRPARWCSREEGVPEREALRHCRACRPSFLVTAGGPAFSAARSSRCNSESRSAHGRSASRSARGDSAARSSRGNGRPSVRSRPKRASGNGFPFVGRVHAGCSIFARNVVALGGFCAMVVTTFRGMWPWRRADPRVMVCDGVPSGRVRGANA
jgi:hypothetical protein